MWHNLSDFLAQSINWWLCFQAAADPGLPTICGSNQGQHGNIRNWNSHELFHLITYLILYMYLYNSSFSILVYVDLGTGASDTATLNFALSGSYSRYYEIKITQLPCSSEYQYVEFLFFFLQWNNSQIGMRNMYFLFQPIPRLLSILRRPHWTCWDIQLS